MKTDIEDRIKEDKIEEARIAAVKRRWIKLSSVVWLPLGIYICTELFASAKQFLSNSLPKIEMNLKPETYVQSVLGGDIELILAIVALAALLIVPHFFKANSSKKNAAAAPAPVPAPIPAVGTVPAPAPAGAPVPTPVGTPVPAPAGAPVPTPVGASTPVPAPASAPTPAPAGAPVPAPAATGTQGTLAITQPGVDTDPYSPEAGNNIRIVICIIFHAVLSYAVWLFLDTYVYSPFGNSGLIVEVVEIASYLALVASLWFSFDMSSIKLNYAAELLIFGKPRFSNIPHGWFCLGIPKWLGTEIQIVDFGLKLITFGIMKNNKREPFIVEGPGYRAIVDLAFSVQGQDTRIILNLKSGTDDDKVEMQLIEKQLVTRMNEVVYRFVNAKNADGTSRFPNIASLKQATAVLSHEILHEKADSINNGETATILLQQLGYKLVSVDVKDVENEDKSIINAQQAKEAKKLLEEAEMYDLENTAKKAQLLYEQWNRIGKPDELPDDKKISMKTCVETVERKEGSRKTYDGLGKAFVQT